MYIFLIIGAIGVLALMGRLAFHKSAEIKGMDDHTEY